MSFVVPESAELLMLRYLLNFTSPDDAVLRLYSNDRTPGESDVVGDYTESSATGYSATVLTGSQWTIAAASGTSSAQYAQRTFTYSTGATVYGYYITNNAGTTLMLAERFSGAPFVLPGGGGEIKVTPVISLD